MMLRSEVISVVENLRKKSASVKECEALDIVIFELNRQEQYEYLRKVNERNEYRRGWHDALGKALSESFKIHSDEGDFDVIQKETIIGLGLSMDSALGKSPWKGQKDADI